MVNISDLEKVRQATGIYSEYKRDFNYIRDIGVRTEAALKIIINDISNLALGDKNKINVIDSYNIPESMKSEIKQLINDIRKFRNYSNHNDVEMVDEHISDIQTKLREDCAKANMSLNMIYEYMFVIYFSKSKYANNLTNLGLFSLLPPFFRHNVLGRYFSVINKIVLGDNDIIAYLRDKSNLDEKKLEAYKMAIHDVKISLENIYDGVLTHDDLSKKNNFYAIDSVLDYICMGCGNDFKHEFSGIFKENNSFDFLKKFNNKNINFKNTTVLKQWLNSLIEDDIMIIEKIKEINVYKLWAYADKYLLAKFKDRGIEETLQYIDNDMHDIYVDNIEEFREYFKNKIHIVDNKIKEKGGLPYTTFRNAKLHFERYRYDYDLTNDDASYLNMLMDETYDRIVSDSKPVKDLSKYFAG